MGRAKSGPGPAAETDAQLAAAYRRAVENVARAAMLSHAAELGRAAGCSDIPGWDGPVVDAAVFGTQMKSLDARTNSVPRLDEALDTGTRQRLESGQFRHAILEAERSELRLEKQATERRR